MTLKQLRAIEQVITINSDICDLYEKRGVSRDMMKEVFRRASQTFPKKEHEDAARGTEKEVP